jgi:hypothetical protein
MNVIIIKDEKTEKSSIAMNVAVGSMQNPKEFEGLAHLLEHMVFLGISIKLLIKKAQRITLIKRNFCLLFGIMQEN